MTESLSSPIAKYEIAMRAPYTGWRDRCSALVNAVKHASLGGVCGGLYGAYLGGTSGQLAKYCVSSLSISAWSKGMLGATIGNGIFLVTGSTLQDWVIKFLVQKDTEKLVYGWVALSIVGSFAAGALGAAGFNLDLLLVLATALGGVVGVTFGASAGKNWDVSRKAHLAFGRAVVGHMSRELLPDSLSAEERKERMFRLTVELVMRHPSSLTEENIPGFLEGFRERLEPLRSRFQNLAAKDFPLGFSFTEPALRTKNRQFILDVRAVGQELMDNERVRDVLRQTLLDGVRTAVLRIPDSGKK